MAGRFLPQNDVNLITRVTRELVGDKQNNKDGIINQECVVYKPSLQESVTNMYGEAAGGKKVYKNGGGGFGMKGGKKQGFKPWKSSPWD